MKNTWEIRGVAMLEALNWEGTEFSIREILFKINWRFGYTALQSVYCNAHLFHFSRLPRPLQSWPSPSASIFVNVCASLSKCPLASLLVLRKYFFRSCCLSFLAFTSLYWISLLVFIFHRLISFLTAPQTTESRFILHMSFRVCHLVLWCILISV